MGWFQANQNGNISVKIALVIERIEAWRGGAETSTMELGRLLTDRGHDVHLITTTNAQSLPKITIHTLRCPAVLRSLRTASFAKRAAVFLRRNEFDIVHAVSPLPSADVYQPRGGLLREVMERNVATRPTASRRLLKRATMAMNVKQKALLDLEARIFRPDGPTVLAVSDYVARQCRRFYNVGEPRVRVVFNGVNVQPPSPEQRLKDRAALREEHQFADDVLVLLFMAHNFRLKGLYPLIETVGRLVVSGFKRFHLLVVGRDNVVPYQKRINAMGLSEYVTFTGPTRRSTEFFLGADVCVHPTFYDPCSRVVLEALSLGRPVITTSFNGAAEVIQDGCNGFVIKTPDDIGLWARRIEDLSSADLRGKIAAKAQSIREDISMTRHVEQLDNVFTEIAERKGCRAAQ